METAELLLSLIKSEITEQKTIDSDFDFDEVALYRLAKRHDLSHFLLGALKRSGLEIKSHDLKEKIKTDAMLSIYRETRTTETTEKIREVFNGAGVDFMLLKGAVLRSLYPNAWMRTSCDIDVLVREKDIERAKDSLVKNGFLTDGKKSYHDYFFRYNETSVELHFSLLENNSQVDGLLSRVWDFVDKKEGREYAEKSEFFVFHHLAHMVYHVTYGGCGIRPFLDLWIMERAGLIDGEKLFPLLDKAGLNKFFCVAEDLVGVWFCGKTHSETTEKLAKYILDGGVYGNRKNANAMKIASSKGKGKYLFKLAFLPYENMCEIYPNLKNRKWLLPFYHIKRLFTKLFSKGGRQRGRRVADVVTTQKENVSVASDLLTELGIKKETRI